MVRYCPEPSAQYLAVATSRADAPTESSSQAPELHSPRMVPNMMPLETLRLWFASFAKEPESARALWFEGATLHAPNGELFTGDFDDFLNWYARRRDDEGAGFSWHVKDLLGGERYAAAVIRLVSDARPAGWDQHAVYEIDDGQIRQIWLHE
jgi:hypothetical protein